MGAGDARRRSRPPNHRMRFIERHGQGLFRRPLDRDWGCRKERCAKHSRAYQSQSTRHGSHFFLPLFSLFARQTISRRRCRDKRHSARCLVTYPGAQAEVLPASSSLSVSGLRRAGVCERWADQDRQTTKELHFSPRSRDLMGPVLSGRRIPPGVEYARADRSRRLQGRRTTQRRALDSDQCAAHDAATNPKATDNTTMENTFPRETISDMIFALISSPADDLNWVLENIGSAAWGQASLTTAERVASIRSY
jgi:hypothetical protein